MRHWFSLLRSSFNGSRVSPISGTNELSPPRRPTRFACSTTTCVLSCGAWDVGTVEKADSMMTGFLVFQFLLASGVMYARAAA